MRIEADRKALEAALAQVAALAPARHSQTAVTHVHVTAGEGHVTLTATNLEQELRVRVPAHVAENGAITAPADTLHTMVRNCPGRVTLFTETVGGGQLLRVTSGAARYKVPTGDPADFPALNFHRGVHATLSGPDLTRALHATRYAVSVNPSMSALRGLRLELAPRGARLVGCDSFRLSVCDVPAEDAPDDHLSALMPARAADDILKAFAGVDVVHLHVADHLLSLHSAHAALNVRLLSYTYPDYQRLLNVSPDGIATFDAAAMKDAVGRVAFLADKLDLTRITLHLTGQEAELRVSGPGGDAQDRVPVQLSGTPMTLALSAQQLLDALATFRGTVTWRLTAPPTPNVMTSEDGTLQALLMPLRDRQ
ncbi:DNA polymerase III subunit beta [Deinococcus kurensis]|uniref:DNA polymerase III subunit beta n=1 Tax=Deinococcus kurensis TaxID=2662757 RepID=UPI0012D33973|nr:DNA polymerase III subunit beta [Deinococcus kurensis]